MQNKSLYYEIANNIKKKIHSNIYKKNELLPSENQLCLEYEVSRESIKKAIRQLAEEGYLYTVAGKGTFVYDCVQNEYISEVNKDMILRNGYDSADLVFASIIKPDVYDVYYMNVSPDESIISMQWLVKKQGVPIAYDIKNLTYVPGFPLDESKLTYSDLCQTIPAEYMHGTLRQTSSFSVVVPPDSILNYFHTENSCVREMMKIQIQLKNVDDEVIGWNIIYVLPEQFILKGESL